MKTYLQTGFIFQLAAHLGILTRFLKQDSFNISILQKEQDFHCVLFLLRKNNYIHVAS